MADWNRRVQRALRDELRPGEDVETTIVLQPLVTTTTAVAPSAGGALGAPAAGHPTATSRSGEPHGIAASLPAAMVLTLTTQRLIALGRRRFRRRPKGIVAMLAPNDLESVEVETGPSDSIVELRFADGSVASYHAPGGDADAFAHHVNGR